MGAKEIPKDGQREPKGVPKRAKGRPQPAQRRPKDYLDKLPINRPCAAVNPLTPIVPLQTHLGWWFEGVCL